MTTVAPGPGSAGLAAPRSGVAGWSSRLSPGAAAALGWSLAVSGAAVLVPPVAAVAGPLYLLGALGIAVTWRLRHHDRLVEFALWLWVLAPGVRRCVDLNAGFQQDSVVLLVAPLVSLLAVEPALYRVRYLRGRWWRLASRVVMVVAYGAAVAVVLARSPVSVGIAGLQVMAPLALGAGMAVGLARDQQRAVLARFATWVPLTVGTYGIVQYVVAPAWDRAWLVSISDVATSFGLPEPLGIRVFSTVNDPGSLAVVLVLCLLVLISRNELGRWEGLAILVGATCLGLTLVRSAWIVLAAALLVLLVRGWVKTGRVVGAAIGLAVVLSVFGTTLAPVLERFESSTESGAGDQSLNDRIAFQTLHFVPALLDPIGSGLGSVGTSVRRDASADQAFASPDSGYLEIIQTYGGPLGSLVVLSIVSACASAARHRRRGLEGAAALAAVMPVQLLFSSVFTSAMGVVFWSCLTLALPVEQDPEEARDGPEGQPEPQEPVS